MESRHQEILRKLQQKIVNDVEVPYIIDALLARSIVSAPLWGELQHCRSNESQTRRLLEILPKRGPEAYSIFKEAIRNDYPWISEQMDTLESTEDCVDSLGAPLGSNAPHTHLPANPPLSVKRTQKMNKLCQGLKDLLPGNYLVLHALQGYGKSTLASATLRDKKVSELFKNEIYWITFGERQSISENILIQLNMLFHLVRNLDPLSEPTSEDALKYSLKRHFSEHVYALIVLDDVNSQDVIEAFDFGCKTLVLTTDVEILRGRSIHTIEMSDGFSANESLDLFAKATGIPVSELPKQARQIHEECKGMPLMISMFSAQFEDIKESLVQGQTSHEIWSYYLNALREKKSDVFQESLERRAATFDLCIEKLSTDDKRFYKTLAIFPEDVNIPTKTLSIFWDMPIAEVDSRMIRFCKKSLACRKWHRLFNTYVYSVHNLVLCHLREKMRPDDLKDLHKLYVEKNFTACKLDFSKLPSDNYIYSYIGYHMEKGGMEERFSEVYLDFGFIEAKVFHIGPGDLLIDLKKYRSKITQDSEELLSRVEDLENFLILQASTLAEYRRRNCLDLVQVALKHPFQGFVRGTAEKLANERPASLYLNHLKHNVEYLNSYSEELHLQVRSVAFTNEADVILVGNDEGKVVSWNCSNRQHVAFAGNSAENPITKIVAPEGQNFFISISADGTAKLFELRTESVRLRNNRFRTLHPRAKQPEWINISEARNSQDDSRMTFAIPNEKILDIAVAREGRKIAACTDKGSIAIWDFDGELLVQPQKVAKESLTSIAFTMHSTLLHAVNSSTGAVVVLEAFNGQYKTQFSLRPESDKIISLLSVPQYMNLLVILLETKLYQVTWTEDGDRYRGPQNREFARLRDKAATYTCAAVTRNGQYIVTADTGGSVSVFQLHGEFEILRTYKNLVSSLDTHWIEDEDCHIICGGNRDTLVPMVHRWKFDPQEEHVVQRLPLFDSTMEPGDRNVIAIATSVGTVQIIQNDDVIAETLPVIGKISSLLIFDDGNRVVYATENGAVFLFDIKLNQSKLIMELTASVDFMTILKVDRVDVIVCNEGSEDLQVWRSDGVDELVESCGSVIFCDVIVSVDRVLTVAETVLKLWDPRSWKLQSKHSSKSVPRTSCCSLSPRQNYLALANASGNLNVLKILPKENLHTVKFQNHLEQRLNERITTCAFSQDEQLLALGSETGAIVIISTETNLIVRKLELHRRPVKKLYWGPSDLEDPVLLSLANELAWWSVSTEPKPRAPREISHSLSELTLSPPPKANSSFGKMRTSRSLELGSVVIADKLSPRKNSGDDSREESFSESLSSSNSQPQSLTNRLNGAASSLWSSKRPKYPKIPGLLGIVKLDGDLATKVCISGDFNYFVTLNGEGSIYNLTIFEPKDGGESNGDT